MGRRRGEWDGWGSGRKCRSFTYGESVGVNFELVRRYHIGRPPLFRVVPDHTRGVNGHKAVGG